MKSLPLGAESFHVDGRTDDGHTDITKLTVIVRNFRKASNDTGVLECVAGRNS